MPGVIVMWALLLPLFPLVPGNMNREQLINAHGNQTAGQKILNTCVLVQL